MLNVIDSCDGCGACCMSQSSPPGYVMILACPERDWSQTVFADDAARVAALPEHVRAELNRYMDGLIKAPTGVDRPCLWLDMETRQCRNYDLRPSICRNEVECGDEACRGWREEFGVHAIAKAGAEMRAKVIREMRESGELRVVEGMSTSCAKSPPQP